LKPSEPTLRTGIRTAMLATVLLGTLTAAVAAPKVVEAFNTTTWPALQQARQPLAVVFTTTDCSHCPAVIDQLARSLRAQRGGAKLVTVVMDLTPGEADAQLLATTHYRQGDRLLAFDGPAAALRHQVNPAWRGVTPYVALLRPGELPRFVMGPPQAGDLQLWLNRR
jgi:folylpolyglutamate synthase/dihydropteroate synthase